MITYSILKVRLEEAIISKYRGKLDQFTMDNVDSDVIQILGKLKAEKQIMDFERVKTYKDANSVGVIIKAVVYVPLGKIGVSLKVQL